MSGVEIGPHHAAAALALAHGDPLAALNGVSGDAGAHARALRGIALAQLQEFDAAERELRAATAAFSAAGEALYETRALAALAEIGVARRELGTSLDALAAAADRLQSAGDERNAAWARLVRVRALFLVGAVELASVELRAVAARLPEGEPALRAAFDLARAAAAARRLSDHALADLDAALGKLAHDEHPLLAAELTAHREALAAPLAKLEVSGRIDDVTLGELASVYRRGDVRPPALGAASRWLVVDAIARRVGFCGEDFVDLASRGVLFLLLLELARAWPRAVATTTLCATVFGAATDDASYRERCRVEIARLRALLPTGVQIEAQAGAWALATHSDVPVAITELRAERSTLMALLADGAAWAARDLASAIGSSQRSVQRALRELADQGHVRAVGRARTQRWVADDGGLGIASQMFLVSLLDPR